VAYDGLRVGHRVQYVAQMTSKGPAATYVRPLNFIPQNPVLPTVVPVTVRPVKRKVAHQSERVMPAPYETYGRRWERRSRGPREA
jgi:hypothetical protein